MTDVSVVECDRCGIVRLSFEQGKIIEEAEKHKDLHPNHDLTLHVFESKTSRKL